MYAYEWDPETGGLLLLPKPADFSKEPRPVYYQELDILGFDKYWNYAKDDSFPYMWAEANNYFYHGRKVAQTKGGSFCHAPEIQLIEDPESDGKPLQFVDVPRMVEKNHVILDSLVQETIKQVYNTYKKYQNKVDVFYVAFSGGKDSVVTLDIVQKALPHNAFKVVYSNTDMELPTTTKLIEQVIGYCNERKISFLEAKANFPSDYTWNKFGPPARKMRWCCTVHKTAPVINTLRKLYSLDRFRSVMITGVRSSESVSRSDYEELSLGKKIAGQYSFHPIIDWDSAELYLYIFEKKLFLNESYKLGLSRVGCLVCPSSTERHEYLKHNLFPTETDKFFEIILNTSSKDLSGDNWKRFLDIGGWKTRFSGRELKISEDERFTFSETKDYYVFQVNNLNDRWKTWYKTIGKLQETENNYKFEYDGVWRSGYIINEGDYSYIQIERQETTKNSIDFISFFKSILAKSQYCIQCGTCEAECPFNCIFMSENELLISDSCRKCKSCLKIDEGCLYFKSIKGSKNMKNTKSLGRYLSVGVNAQWIEDFIKDPTYEPGNRKTDSMFSFLSDGGVVFKKQLTEFGKFIQENGFNNSYAWALILSNLVYSPVFSWYVHNVPFNEKFSRYNLDDVLGEEIVKKTKDDFWNGFKVIIYSNSTFQNIGLGTPEIEKKETKTGDVKMSMISITRTPWLTPDPRVILYSLYKFAEACDGYYQFSLTRLLDHEIESEGVSPTQIFGLNRATMEEILKGLSVNYPEFISTAFNLGLDTINLNREKTSSDVLSLF